MAARRKRVLGTLVSLTYDPDPLVAWRAVDAMGGAAARIAEEDPEFVRSHLRRLHWLLSEESGGICLHAPPAMAEIVRRKHGLFADYLPVVFSLLVDMAEEDLEHFRDGILWAIGRLAPVGGEEIDAILPALVACLDHEDSQIRGMAAWCLTRANKGHLLASRPCLLSDQGPVEIYENGRFRRTTVCDLIGPANPDRV